jgi:hypothetical protein
VNVRHNFVQIGAENIPQRSEWRETGLAHLVAIGDQNGVLLAQTGRPRVRHIRAVLLDQPGELLIGDPRDFVAVKERPGD